MLHLLYVFPTFDKYFLGNYVQISNSYFGNIFFTGKLYQVLYFYCNSFLYSNHFKEIFSRDEKLRSLYVIGVIKQIVISVDH